MIDAIWNVSKEKLYCSTFLNTLINLTKNGNVSLYCYLGDIFFFVYEL